jgi:hypothetical protein
MESVNVYVPYIKHGLTLRQFSQSYNHSDIFIDIFYTEFYLNWTQNVENRTQFFYAIK